jgi:hypothetical protein
LIYVAEIVAHAGQEAAELYLFELLPHVANYPDAEIAELHTQMYARAMAVPLALPAASQQARSEPSASLSSSGRKAAIGPPQQYCSVYFFEGSCNPRYGRCPRAHRCPFCDGPHTVSGCHLAPCRAVVAARKPSAAPTAKPATG